MAPVTERISVALVTRNRVESLERTLRSLRAQDLQPYEVIVSDDSDPAPAHAVRKLTRSFDCRYVEGPRRGLYANRNHSALACTGSHIRTMDDDHEFPAQHFDACALSVANDPEAVWIIGERQPSAPLADGFRCPPQLHPRGFSVIPGANGSLWAISDGAAIYPRLLFDRGLRFVEDFPFGASYLEWGSRLRWLGYRIRHLASTYVIHHHDPAARSYADDGVDLTSRFFAMFAHSFLYQPTITNRVLCAAEVGKQLVIRRRAAMKAVRQGWDLYRHRRPLALHERATHLGS
jgi:glycosyltransferase involved in cell wall biosynthesis